MIEKKTTSDNGFTGDIPCVGTMLQPDSHNVAEVIDIDEMDERDFVIEYVLSHGVELYNAEAEIEQIRQLWRMINR